MMDSDVEAVLADGTVMVVMMDGDTVSGTMTIDAVLKMVRQWLESHKIARLDYGTVCDILTSSPDSPLVTLGVTERSREAVLLALADERWHRDILKMPERT